MARRKSSKKKQAAFPREKSPRARQAQMAREAIAMVRQPAVEPDAVDVSAFGEGLITPFVAQVPPVPKLW